MNKESQKCYVCTEACVPFTDGYCRECLTMWHFTCCPAKSYRQGAEMRCFKCKNTVSNATIGLWCLRSYERGMAREGTMYDMNYVKDGVIVAFMPYRWTALNGFIPLEPFISANISRELEEWTKSNWYYVSKALWINLDRRVLADPL